MPTRFRSRTGLTLVEVLISLGILGIVLTATYFALVLSLRYYQKTRDAADIQKEALAVMGRLERTMSHAGQDSVLVDTEFDGPGGPRVSPGTMQSIVFASAETSSTYYSADQAGPDAGKPKFQRWICVFPRQLPTGRFDLVQGEALFPAPVVSPPPTPSLLVMQTLPGYRETVLTHNLYWVYFPAGSVIQIDLRVQSPGYDADPPRGNGLQVSSQVLLSL